MCLIFFLCGCSTHQQENPKRQIAAENDSLLIDSLGLRTQFINWKWKIYCIYCDEKLDFVDSSIIHDDITFGMLPLRFDRLSKSDDTVVLSFMFYYKDSLRCVPRFISNYINYDAAYKIGIDTPLYYMGFGDGRFREWCADTLNCTSRYVKPLQPEVIEYIKQNKEVIDPWFRAEAVKRGVIDG